MKKILVTGGAGYIGSHTALLLLQQGFDVVVLDNFSNSAPASLTRVESIAKKSITVVNGDVRDANCLDEIFLQHDIAAVIHFAGLKAVGESVREPLRYYDNNVVGTLRLVEAMNAAGNKDSMKRLIFSSSATVYSVAGTPRFTESSPLGPASPYGTSKLMAEQILRDCCVSNQQLKVTLLRYFNPVGAHESGMLGENPNGIPNNLMPFISQVAIGKLKTLSIYGNDYPTPDGTGIRDYIHVMDLAEGHLAALNSIEHLPQVAAINLGSGQGHSVLDVIAAFENAADLKIPTQTMPRRAGDIAEYFADASLAKELLGWSTKRNLSQVCKDSWRWQQQNPQGYQ